VVTHSDAVSGDAALRRKAHDKVQNLTSGSAEKLPFGSNGGRHCKGGQTKSGTLLGATSPGNPDISRVADHAKAYSSQMTTAMTTTALRML